MKTVLRFLFILFVLVSAFAFILACSGCKSGTAAAPQTVNIATVMNNTTNALEQALAAYNALLPYYTQLKPIVEQYEAGKKASERGAVAPIEKPAARLAPSERSAAVICGLTRVDPRRYGGWGGACPGCDVDAEAFAIACQSEGVPYELLLNEQASSIGIVASAKRAVATLKPGDLLILYLSGHGGQQQDTTGDEADGRDETLCLWDGPLSDDVVWQTLAQVPKGIRVWMITDTCNSGTSYRAPHRYKARNADGPTLLHWGGCADGKSSFGSEQGGTFTTALVDAYKPGQSYADWFAGAKRRMPATQIPTCEFTGDDYQSLPAFR